MSLGAVAISGSIPIITALPPPSLSAPVYVDHVKTESVSDTFLIENLTGLTADAVIIVVAATRSTSANRTHNAPTIGLNLNSSLVLVDSINEVQPSTTNNIRASMWIGRLSGTPGTGNLQMMTNGNVSQGVLAVYTVVGAALPQLTKGADSETTGTTLTVAFEDIGTPAANTLSIGLYGQNGAGGTGIAASGFTSLTDMAIDFGSNMRTWLGYDLTSPANNVPFTGGQSGNAKSGVAVLLGQQ